MTLRPQDAIIEQITALIDAYQPDVHGDLHGDFLQLPTTRQQEAQARATAAIHRFTLSGSSYRNEMQAILAQDLQPGWSVPRLLGLLTAVRDDYAAGYMQTVELLVHADLFADFLEMADDLVTKGYKDAAAVIGGSVLEEHLRKLAGLHAVSITSAAAHKKADVINADLVKAGAYNKLEQKSVTAWLGLRNDAAHGNYTAYDHRQVEALLRDVRDFMTRHPA